MIICTKDTSNSDGRDMQKLFPIKRTERIFILREKSKDARRIERFVLFSLFHSLSLLENEFPIFFAMLHNSVTLRRDRWLLRLNTLNFNGIPSSRSFHESGIKKFSPRGRGEGTIGI